MKRTVFPIAVIVLLAFGAYTALAPESGRLDSDQSTHFAVSDTASIQKIRIADNNGRVAALQRAPDDPLGLWRLNDRYPARKDATDLLLKTFKRISVRQPVRASAKEGVLKMMASAGKRVDIFAADGSAPIKILRIARGAMRAEKLGCGLMAILARLHERGPPAARLPARLGASAARRREAVTNQAADARRSIQQHHTASSSMQQQRPAVAHLRHDRVPADRRVATRDLV